MARSRSARMQPVNHLAVKKEEESAVAYAECMSKVRNLEIQLQKLFTYREEYHRQLRSSSQTSASSRLQDCLQFIQNLNQSIERIQKLIKKQQNECDVRKQDWIAKHRQKRIYQKVTDKYLLEERRQAERQEQKRSDEFNQAMYYRKLKNLEIE